MQNEKVEQFQIMGISVRTTNHDQQAAKDIPALWGKFMTEEILNQIPNKISNTIYAVYTGYEGDHTQPYTTVLGCAVSSIEQIPDGMTIANIPSGIYAKFTPKGNLKEDLIINQWLKIWQSDLNRAYQSDFELFDDRAQNPNDAEVDIFIGLKE